MANPMNGAASPEKMGFSSERLARLDAGLRAVVDKGMVPGIATVLVRHGKVVNSDVYGKVDSASGAPVAATCFASVSSA